MAAPLALKVTFDGDTRKITSPPEELFAAIASRFSLDQPDLIQLQFDEQDVDLDWIIALSTTVKVGKPLKVSMRIKPPAPEYVPAPDFTPTAPPASNQTATCDDRDYENQDNREQPENMWGDKDDWRSWKNACKSEWNKWGDKDDWRSWKKACKSEWNKWGDKDDWRSWKKAWKGDWKGDWKGAMWSGNAWGDCDNVDPAMLKVKAQETKAVAKELAMQAKAEEKAFKVAAKAQIVAQKAAKQAAKQAAKAAQHAEKAAQKEAHTVHTGKLVNYVDHNDPCAVFGDLTILPDGRICFHCESHQGNLRVTKQAEVQKCGGKGDHAQWEPISEDKAGVFRLQSHKFPDQFLGVALSDDASLSSFSSCYGFISVPQDSTAGLWSFYPEGQNSPLEFQEAEAAPGPRDVYHSIQEYIDKVSKQSKLPITLGDAPEDETELVEMLNSLHDILPHSLKRIAMKKLGLRVFELPQTTPQEWDAVIQELVEMGFENHRDNLMAVNAAEGDLKQAVRHLVKAMHAQ